LSPSKPWLYSTQLPILRPDHENSDIDSNSGNTATLNKTKTKFFFGIPGKVIRLSESTNSANATITQSNAKNLPTKNLEKTEDSTKVNQDHALQVENMSELEKIDLLACKITAKLVIANEEKKRKEIAITESNEFWIDSDEFWICNPCLCHSSSKNVPDHLSTLKRGCFGYVGKTGKKSMIKASKERHLKSSLHKWCVQEYLKVAERKIAADRRNDLAGKKIVRNALFCFKQSLSSADFMALNMKDFLAEEEF
jgi:hypothetical protein